MGRIVSHGFHTFLVRSCLVLEGQHFHMISLRFSLILLQQVCTYVEFVAGMCVCLQLLYLSLSLHTAIHLPQGHTISSDSFRNFIALEVNIPRHSLHRATGVRLKVQSFEAVAWLPVIGMVTSVLVSLRFKGGKRAEQIEVSLSLHLY